MRPVSEEKDIDELHHGQIMENLKLENKGSRALGNTDHQKSKLFKDVSPMANASGGIINDTRIVRCNLAYLIEDNSHIRL